MNKITFAYDSYYLLQRNFGPIHGRITFVVYLCKYDDVFSRHIPALVYPEDGVDVTRDATAAADIRGLLTLHRCLEIVRREYFQ